MSLDVTSYSQNTRTLINIELKNFNMNKNSFSLKRTDEKQWVLKGNGRYDIYEGTFNISRLDTINDIIAGTFSFDAKDSVENKTIKITEGRFDLRLKNI